MPAITEVMPRLPVRDLGKTLAFYDGLLEFDVDVIWPDEDPTFAILQRGSARVGFFTTDEHRVVTATGNVELVFETEGIEQLFEDLTNSGCEIEWGPEVYYYGRREFALRDPDGNLIIFSEPTDDPQSSPEG